MIMTNATSPCMHNYMSEVEIRDAGSRDREEDSVAKRSRLRRPEKSRSFAREIAFNTSYIPVRSPVVTERSQSESRCPLSKQ